MDFFPVTHPLDETPIEDADILPTKDAILVMRDMLRHEHRNSSDPIPEGVFQESVLDSALERARHGPFPPFVVPDLFLRTAFLVRGIAGEHAFANGCKRTGLMVMGTTLHMNGHRLEATQEQAVDFMMSIADKNVVDPLEIAAWIREKSRKSHQSFWKAAFTAGKAKLKPKKS